MKVYLVERDNGEMYEDYQTYITSAHLTYRNASQQLIDDGYEPYPTTNYEGDTVLYFCWQESDEYMAESSHAEIIEIEVTN
ncbi:hypothetical protein [Oceanobacillus sp. FSL H7-0719]|uniref:hypothetical protein n=1 Tax=Oceanobacillus sp. FSL H7-0719 TaxID=2954507 RepID=UPI00324A9B60